MQSWLWILWQTPHLLQNLAFVNFSQAFTAYSIIWELVQSQIEYNTGFQLYLLKNERVTCNLFRYSISNREKKFQIIGYLHLNFTDIKNFYIYSLVKDLKILRLGFLQPFVNLKCSLI